MPSCLLEYALCRHCRGRRQRKDMSVFGGICAQCFEQHYQICNTCGALIHRGNAFEGGRCYRCYIVGHGRQSVDNHWPSTPLDVSFATYQRIHSKRKYGVEIETSVCRGYMALQGNTVFGSKADCTISGREFDSPILYGDEGLTEIEKFLAYAEEKHWAADEDCGCHTHYDMREESVQELFRIAYAYAKTYSFWSNCVSRERRDSSYCEAPSYTAEDIRGEAEHSAPEQDSVDYQIAGISFSTGDPEANQCAFEEFCGEFERYDYVNLTAYNDHRTFEVRLLEGTVDAETICNWITIHARFMDYVKGLSFDDLDYLLNGDVKHILSAFAEIIDDVDLVDWLIKRIEEFSPGLLN